MDPDRSWASSPATRATMIGNRSRDTKPEMAVRRRAHGRGLRYRVDIRPEPSLNRRADLVFTRAKVAVFVDGCFWHGCPEHHNVSKTNAAYWAAKVEGNMARDAETDRLLSDAGWTIIRAWEHEDPNSVVEHLVAVMAEANTRPMNRQAEAESKFKHNPWQQRPATTRGPDRRDALVGPSPVQRTRKL